MSIQYKVWVEINKQAVADNISLFRNLIGRETELWAVVKSNAYGHGLSLFSRVADESGVDGFCVDSVKEAVRLRADGINKPILVLGPTFPNLFEEAWKNKITLTISNSEFLRQLSVFGQPIDFHLKLDTGMRRQGFYLDDLEKNIESLRKLKDSLRGVYTHFASAKDINYPTYTEQQFLVFQRGIEILRQAGFHNLVCHAAATGGALISDRYHLNVARIGIGFYGLWPSKELEIQLGQNAALKPVLSWRTLISEIKTFKKGDYIGYDLSERAFRDGRLAILPIGYWHGLSRSLSGVGEVLIGNQRARVLGKISMDMTVVDVSEIDCRIGDQVTLIGEQQGERIEAADLARRTGTISYDIVTGINPLIKRILV